MSFSLWIFDDTAASARRLAHGLDERAATILQAMAEEIAPPVGHRAKAVFVEEIYDRELYDRTRRHDEAPIKPGHTFPSAVEAAYHLGLKAPVVRDAIRHKREQPMGETNAEGITYPAGTVKLGGLALCWEKDARV
jgi:hypothetical protein